MEYKIIASDLDGTLLDSYGKVSKENWEAIEELTNRGVHFVPASGRAYMEMPKEIRESPLIRYYITSDGAMIYDKETDTTHEFSLSKSTATRILDKLYQYPVCMMVHADTNSYVDIATHNDAHYRRFNMNIYWRVFTFLFEKTIPDIKKFMYDHDNIHLFVPFFKKLTDLNECRAYLEQDKEIIIAQSTKHNLEIFSSKAGKGNALISLADMLGVDRRATIAVGDSTNDYTMVKAAGLGLAMENAVDELKAVADEVICHHLQHSAKYILEHYI